MKYKSNELLDEINKLSDNGGYGLQEGNYPLMTGTQKRGIILGMLDDIRMWLYLRLLDSELRGLLPAIKDSEDGKYGSVQDVNDKQNGIVTGKQIGRAHV